jgi:hypothetical protein
MSESASSADTDRVFEPFDGLWLAPLAQSA